MAQILTITTAKSFQRAYKRRILPSPELDRRTETRINLFKRNSQHPSLKDHALTGKMQGLRAFSITGDIRIVYQRLSFHHVMFLDIGTHSQVY